MTSVLTKTNSGGYLYVTATYTARCNIQNFICLPGYRCVWKWKGVDMGEGKKKLTVWGMTVLLAGITGVSSMSVVAAELSDDMTQAEVVGEESAMPEISEDDSDLIQSDEELSSEDSREDKENKLEGEASKGLSELETGAGDDVYIDAIYTERDEAHSCQVNMTALLPEDLRLDVFACPRISAESMESVCAAWCRRHIAGRKAGNEDSDKENREDYRTGIVPDMRTLLSFLPDHRDKNWKTERFRISPLLCDDREHGADHPRAKPCAGGSGQSG